MADAPDEDRPMTYGPNTHRYLDAEHITSWTIVPLDDVDGVRHYFHIPTVILDAERALAALDRTEGSGLRAALKNIVAKVWR